MFAQESIPQDRTDRIRELSFPLFNRSLDLKTQRTIRGVMAMGPLAVEERLKELEKEWDIDRAFMLGLSLVLIPQLLMARKSRNWLRVPILQTSFLFMRATLGWCPPDIPLRALGFRTRKEIQNERETLLSAIDERMSEH